MGELIPVLGILTGIIIPLAAFIWLYFEGKGKREAALEIAKHLQDPSQVEELLRLFEERKSEPLDYRRGGVITLSVGIGLYLLGLVALGPLLKGIGLLVGTISIGTFLAGHLFPHTGAELTDAVDKYEAP